MFLTDTLEDIDAYLKNIDVFSKWTPLNTFDIYRISEIHSLLLNSKFSFVYINVNNKPFYFKIINDSVKPVLVLYIMK